jgi:hypothetical protein
LEAADIDTEHRALNCRQEWQTGIAYLLLATLAAFAGVCGSLALIRGHSRSRHIFRERRSRG